jgi:hypothetical protein
VYSAGEREFLSIEPYAAAPGIPLHLDLAGLVAAPPP